MAIETGIVNKYRVWTKLLSARELNFLLLSPKVSFISTIQLDSSSTKSKTSPPASSTVLSHFIQMMNRLVEDKRGLLHLAGENMTKPVRECVPGRVRLESNPGAVWVL